MMDNRIKKLISAFVTSVFLLSAISLSVSAADYIDMSKNGSLTLCYQYDNYCCEGVDVRIFRVAEVSDKAEYTLTDAFADYPVKVNDLQTSSQWQETANAFAAYAAADSIQPTQTEKSENDGVAVFSNLKTGLYLVVSENAVYEDCSYIFAPFLISVPSPNESNQWTYEVLANPKAEVYYPQQNETEHKVVKQWEDSGNESNRPDSISVYIIKDGLKVDEQVLSNDNDWSYSWTAPDDGSVWQAVESNVAQPYTVTIQNDGTTITIVNTAADIVSSTTPLQINTPLQTGSGIEIWICILLVLGFGMVMLAVIKRKR
jgi:hypothetical protein